MTRCAVVGGGMLGMTLALRMARDGWSVTLYEQNGHLGGLVEPWRLNTMTWDRHPQVMLRSDSMLLRLMRELRLNNDVEWGAARTNLFVDGRTHPFTSTFDHLRFPALGTIDKTRIALMMRRMRRHDDEDGDLEHLDVETWLREACGDRAFETFWRPLLLAKFGGAYARTNARHMRVTIARLYASARHGGVQRFGYVRGGYTSIVDAFSRALLREGVRIRTATAIQEVRSEDRQLWVETSDGGGGRIYDRVVMTIPAPAIARVASALSGEERERLRAIEYQGVVCASMLLDQPFGNTYLTRIIDENVPFTTAVEMTALVHPAFFGDRRLVYLSRYCSPGESSFSTGDAEIRAQAIAALARMCPSFKPQSLRAFRVSRVPAAFALPLIGYSGRVPGFVTSCPGLYIVNSAQIVEGPPTVNETLALAHQAAWTIAEDQRYASGGIRETAR
jgi:protoporphyrinogen oxidase